MSNDFCPTSFRSCKVNQWTECNWCFAPWLTIHQRAPMFYKPDTYRWPLFQSEHRRPHCRWHLLKAGQLLATTYFFVCFYSGINLRESNRGANEQVAIFTAFNFQVTLSSLGTTFHLKATRTAAQSEWLANVRSVGQANSQLNAALWDSIQRFLKTNREQEHHRVQAVWYQMASLLHHIALRWKIRISVDQWATCAFSHTAVELQSRIHVGKISLITSNSLGDLYKPMSSKNWLFLVDLWSNLLMVWTKGMRQFAIIEVLGHSALMCTSNQALNSSISVLTPP